MAWRSKSAASLCGMIELTSNAAKTRIARATARIAPSARLKVRRLTCIWGRESATTLPARWRPSPDEPAGLEMALDPRRRWNRRQAGLGLRDVRALLRHGVVPDRRQRAARRPAALLQPRHLRRRRWHRAVSLAVPTPLPAVDPRLRWPGERDAASFRRGDPDPRDPRRRGAHDPRLLVPALARRHRADLPARRGADRPRATVRDHLRLPRADRLAGDPSGRRSADRVGAQAQPSRADRRPADRPRRRDQDGPGADAPGADCRQRETGARE